MNTGGGHKVAEAINTLDAAIKGFWVEMPLDWGQGEASTPRAPANSPQSIAADDRGIAGVAEGVVGWPRERPGSTSPRL